MTFEEKLLGLGFPFLALLETSFFSVLTLPHFELRIVFIAIFLVVFLKPNIEWQVPALTGGFFLDLFSGGLFGLKTLGLFLIMFLCRTVLDFFTTRTSLLLILSFSLGFVAYNLLDFSLAFGPQNLLYNLSLSVIGFKIWDFYSAKIQNQKSTL